MCRLDIMPLAYSFIVIYLFWWFLTNFAFDLEFLLRLTIISNLHWNTASKWMQNSFAILFFDGTSIYAITQANDFGDLYKYIIFLITSHSDQSSNPANSIPHSYCCNLIQALITVTLTIIKDLDFFFLFSVLLISLQGNVHISKYKLNLLLSRL